MSRSDFNLEQLAQFEQHALAILPELAQVAMSYFKTALTPGVKADRSLVSAADTAIEKRARELLAQLTPEFGFVGEEMGSLKTLANDLSRKSNTIQETNQSGLNHFEMNLQLRPEESLNLDNDTFWILDPIDGTLNFLSHNPTWSILLALVHEGVPVLGVVALPGLDEIFIASQGHGARLGHFSQLSATNNEQRWQVCAPRSTNLLSESIVSYSTPKTFAYRGIESFHQVLMQDTYECRTYSDAYGYTRILCGGIDVMIDPQIAPYDVAALQVLFDETPGAVFTTLHGHSGSQRFRMGSAVACASAELAQQTLSKYRKHLLSTAEQMCLHNDSALQPLHPDVLSPTFLLPYEASPSAHPAKVWARAVETAVAGFLLDHPEASVEDVSVLLGAREAASRALSNGRDEAPPEVSASSSFHIRAIVSGGTGLITGTPDTSMNLLHSIRSALDAAWHQVAECSPSEREQRLLAARDQLIAHVGQHPWQAVKFAKHFQSTSALIQMQHKAPSDSRIHSLKSRLNMSAEYRWQYFLDSAQQTFVNQVCRVSTNATCSEGEEKRTAYARYLQNKMPASEDLSSALEHHFSKVKKQALDLLAASLVPEEPEYDYLAADADLLGLILHEAIGHAAEGDLIQTRASGFGESGVMKDLHVGPDWMDILIDGSLDNCGYLPVDAEGVLPRRKTLVRNGRLVDAIHTRHTALQAQKTPDGCARIQSLQYPSLNRMTSIWVCPENSKQLDVSAGQSQWDDLSPNDIQKALEAHGYLEGEKGVLLLSGWKGGTASCSNLEFRADVARVMLLKKGTSPRLMREANFTGIATECFRSAVDAFGPTLCRSIGTCGKDGQGVLTSDGGPAFMVFKPNPKVRVIGTGESGEE